MFEGQTVIPAISTHQDLDTFLKSDLDYGILMSFQLAQLPELVQAMHKHGKKVLVHLDMIKGLASDPYGAIYLIQKLRVFGIISIKPKVIDLCKKRGVLGILRFFLKDTLSLHQSLDILKRVEPDAVEVLPAIKSDIIDRIRANTGAQVLMGGLIQDRSQIDACLESGAIAVTVSTPRLWNPAHTG
ncbi:MAG: glycerol-3-phosphate responsive antiterminator [Bacillota bacterium]